MRSRETVAQLRQSEPAFAAADTRFLGSLYVAAAMDGETATHLRVSPSRAAQEAPPREATTPLGFPFRLLRSPISLFPKPISLLQNTRLALLLNHAPPLTRHLLHPVASNRSKCLRR